MEGTRARILDLLRERGEVTVDELTQALAMAPATVRRHLDVLQRDGFVDARPVRRMAGRPHYAFSLTELGGDLLPHHYIRMTARLVEEMVALSPQETSGRSGREVVSLVFERLADSLAKTYAPLINGVTAAERLRQTIDVLADEGLVFESVTTDEGFLLKGQDCPCRRIAGGEDICAHDARLLSRLLNTPVNPVSAPDGWSCAYQIRLD